MDINYSNTLWGLGSVFGNFTDNSVRDKMFMGRELMNESYKVGTPTLENWLPPSRYLLYDTEVKPTLQKFVGLLEKIKEEKLNS